MTPRGIRNNNPGNIRISKSPWRGKVPGDDPSFETFINMEYGVRAIFVLLRNYIKHGNDTIEKMISRWAPDNENETERYIEAVVTRTGMSHDMPIEPTLEMLGPIARAICAVENGGNYVEPQTFTRAWEIL